MTHIHWRPASRHADRYIVSDLGHVRALGSGLAPRVRYDAKNGVTVLLKRVRRYRPCGLAELVLESFGQRRPSMSATVMHKNGKRQDCRLCNLAWVVPPRQAQSARDTSAYVPFYAAMR